MRKNGRKNVRCFLNLISGLREIWQKYGRFFGRNPRNQKARTRRAIETFDGIFLHSFQTNGFSIVLVRTKVNSFTFAE